MASIFGITTTEVERAMRPSGWAGQSSFSISDGTPITDVGAAAIVTAIRANSALTEDQAEQAVASMRNAGTIGTAEAQAIIEAVEQEAMGYLPVDKQRLLTRVDGEYLTGYAPAFVATGGETSLQLGMFPVVSGSLKLYRNYGRNRAWSDPDRSQSDEWNTGYTLNATTGALTLATPLAAGDQVLASYNHTGASQVLDLRLHILSKIVVEIARRCGYMGDPEQGAVFEARNVSAAGYFRDVREGRQRPHRLFALNIAGQQPGASPRIGMLDGLNSAQRGGWYGYGG